MQEALTQFRGGPRSGSFADSGRIAGIKPVVIGTRRHEVACPACYTVQAGELPADLATVINTAKHPNEKPP